VIRHFLAVDGFFRGLLRRRAGGSAGKRRAAHGEYGSCGKGKGEFAEMFRAHGDAPVDLQKYRHACLPLDMSVFRARKNSCLKSNA
jgi:hypothetical protein